MGTKYLPSRNTPSPSLIGMEAGFHLHKGQPGIMHTPVVPVKESRAVRHSATSSAIVVLSSSLAVLYASPGGLAVLRDLKGTNEGELLQIPAPVLAYLADGILKNIDVRRMLHVYEPFSIPCSIQGPTGIWYCQAFGLPSRDEIDRSRIVMLFSDKPPHGRSAEQRDLVPTSSSSSLLLDPPVLETNAI